MMLDISMRNKIANKMPRRTLNLKTLPVHLKAAPSACPHPYRLEEEVKLVLPTPHSPVLEQVSRVAQQRRRRCLLLSEKKLLAKVGTPSQKSVRMAKTLQNAQRKHLLL